MRPFFAALALLVASFALTPAASAVEPICDTVSCPDDICDVRPVCTTYVPNDVTVSPNGDGSYTLTRTECRYDGWCRTSSTTTPRLPHDPRVVSNGDGSYSVVYRQCTSSTTCGDVEAARSPRVLTCYTYNPAALTNFCVTTGEAAAGVTHPAVGTTGRTTCIVGQELCYNHPWPTLGSATTYVTVPTADGYVEITAACGFGAPCRITV